MAGVGYIIRCKAGLAIRRITHSLEKQKILADTQFLKKKFPQLEDYKTFTQQYRDRYLKDYEYYVENVSCAGHAVSFEQVLFMRGLCDLIKPKRVLDLGSGFSSYIFRDYAASGKDIVVWSIDNDSAWLQKTKDYLEEKNISSDNLVLWQDFIKGKREPFDLILHDMGDMAFRQSELNQVLNMAKPGGLVILDDVHKRIYGRYLKQLFKRSNIRYYNLHSFTYDPLCRYSFMVHKKK